MSETTNLVADAVNDELIETGFPLTALTKKMMELTTEKGCLQEQYNRECAKLASEIAQTQRMLDMATNDVDVAKIARAEKIVVLAFDNTEGSRGTSFVNDAIAKVIIGGDEHTAQGWFAGYIKVATGYKCGVLKKMTLQEQEDAIYLLRNYQNGRYMPPKKRS